MSNDVDFQIVCSGCGCLAIRIEEPLKASREATVYCGDCGTARGTVGALRDLAVRRSPEITFSAPSAGTLVNVSAADDLESDNEISKQYDELRRLRRKVEIAESHARTSNRRLASMGRTRRRDASFFHFLSPLRAETGIYIDGEGDQKRRH
jgi:hypothetical protein